MTSYLSSFATRWESEFQIDLIHELRDALRDTPRKARFGVLFAELYQILNFCVEIDGIYAWLGKKRAVLELTSAFLAQHKHHKAHQVMVELLAFSLPAKAMKSKKIDFSALLLELSNQANVNLGHTSKNALALAQYAAINAAFAENPESELENKLHTVLPDIERAVVMAIAAQGANWDIKPPLKLRQLAAAKQRVPNSASNSLAAILNRKNQQIWANTTASSKPKITNKSLAFAVAHAPGHPANPDALAKLNRKSAQELKQIYALHDGAELFVVDGAPGLILAPMAQWDELLYELENRLSLYFGSVQRIPAGVRSAIAFAYVPGDSERWLLITNGKYAGSVRLSDMDSIDGTPNFATLAHFFEALATNPISILSNGGYVQYMRDGKRYFPAKYDFEKSVSN